jgi:hypothetical protein
VIGNPARRNAPDNANVTQTTNPAPAQPIRTGRTRFLLTMTPRTRLHHPPTAHPPDVVTTTASSSYRVTVHTKRRGKNQPLLDRSVLILLAKQKGRCPLCTGLLLHADHEPSSPTEWEQWHRVTRKAITKHYVTAEPGTGTPDGTRLVHSHCQRRATGATKEPALFYA